jgi:hypothetical protein
MPHGSDHVAVSGLRGAQGGSAVPLMASNGSSLIWDGKRLGLAGFNNATNASVYLHVKPNATIYTGISYTISFQVINPPFDQVEQNIYIEAGGGSPKIIFIEMPKVRMVLSLKPVFFALL